MGLFNKDKTDGTPPAGDGDGNGNGEDKGFVTVEAFNAGFGALQESLKTMAESIKMMGEQQKNYVPPQAADAKPPEDPHKETKARIAEIGGELKKINAQIEKAAKDDYGAGIGDMLNTQQTLMAEQAELRGKLMQPTGQDSRMDVGFRTLDSLATEVLSAKMPYLNVKEVKDYYDNHMAGLPTDQRMLPEVKQGVYNLAVGANLAVIEDLRKQEWLREQEDPTQDPANSSAHNRQKPGEGGPPRPEDVLSPDALRTIKTSKYRTPNRYYESLGYEGWDDYYEKNKEYFGEEEGV